MVRPLQSYEIDDLYVGIINKPTNNTNVVSQNLDRNLYDLWSHNRDYPDARSCLRAIHCYSTGEPRGDYVRWSDDLQFIVYPMNCFDNENTCTIRCAFFQNQTYSAHFKSAPFRLTPKRVYRKMLVKEVK